MTEDKAKTKACPLSATFGASQQLVDGPGPRCIGSVCMAWRWDEPWTSQVEEGHGGDVVIRLKRKPGEPMLGFCGLAGAPR